MTELPKHIMVTRPQLEKIIGASLASFADALPTIPEDVLPLAITEFAESITKATFESAKPQKRIITP